VKNIIVVIGASSASLGVIFLLDLSGRKKTAINCNHMALDSGVLHPRSHEVGVDSSAC